MNVTAETFHALATPADYAELPLANNLTFYVDGSVSGSQAAWSVVAVHYDFHGSPALQGCLSGSVVVNSAAPDWIGATTTDNITAELTAAIAAMIAALCQESTMQIVIRPDLRLSAMLASLEWQCTSHPEMSTMCQVVGTWFAKINGQFIEVRGHTRHPWNDLADSLARWSACHAREVGHISWTPFSDLLRSGDYKWAWLLEARETMHQCLPPGSTQGSWQLTPSYRKVDEPAPIPLCNDWTCMHFCIASANV